MRNWIFGAIALSSAFGQTALAADCGSLKLLNSVQMSRLGSHDFVPMKINGVDEQFLFDTGGLTTQISRGTVDALKLPVRQGNFEMYDLTGHISRDAASVKQFTLGSLHGEDAEFPVSPFPMDRGGILSMNYLLPYDADVDFGTDELKFFSQDHCPGGVLYWTAPSVAVVPITMRAGHITIPVTLDGHELTAIVDTGASGTSLRVDIAEHLYGLTMGAVDTPEDGVLNGDAGLKIYRHTFKNLSLGDIGVVNARIDIIPDAMNRNGDHAQQVGNRALLVKDNIVAPEVIVGMNILRRLHVYMAFAERKMYISPTFTAQPSPATPPGAPPANPQ